MMEVNRLLGDELGYELFIRGLPVRNTVAERRTMLREALRVEKQQGIITISSRVQLDVMLELDICQQKLEDLEQDILEFDQQNRVNEFKRINTRLLHISSRLGRISGSDVDSEIRRLSLVNRITRLLEDLHRVYDGLELCRMDDGRQALQTRQTVSSRSILDEENPPLQAPALAPDAAVVHDLMQFGERVEPSNSPNNIRTTTTGDNRVQEGELNSYQQNRPQDGNDRSLPQYSTSPGNQLHSDVSGRIQCVNPALERQFTEMNLGNGQTQYGEQLPPLRNRSYSQVHFLPVENSSHVTNNNWSRQAGPPTPVTVSHQVQPILSHHKDNVSEIHPENNTYHPPRDTFVHSSNVGSSFSEYRQPDVARWNVKFTGRNSVSEFLERIAELSNSRGVSKAQLLRSAPELFSQEALLWYRTNTFSDWDELTRKLKEDYLPYDYEYGLWDEIRHRTQGAQERVLTFVVAMESLFRKLPNHPLEETRLNLIRRNLLPHIQKQLALHHVNSLAGLIKLAREVEETELRTQRFVPPPVSTRGLLEPELAYKKTNYQSAISSIEPKHEVESTNNKIELVQIPESTAKAPTCWNCNRGNHKFRSCPEPRKKFCYRCGQPNVIADNCPKCTKNSKRGH